MKISEKSSVTDLKGVGEKAAESFRTMGVENVGDLLKRYPVRYDKPERIRDIAETEPGESAAIRGQIMTAAGVYGHGSRQVTSVQISDGTGRMHAVWFHMPYLKKTLHKGDMRIFRGKIVKNQYGLTIEQPAMYAEDEYASIEGMLRPVYELCGSLKQKQLQKAVHQALEEMIPTEDFLPLAVREDYGLIDRSSAFRKIHFPESEEELLTARRRLVFEEFFQFILAVRKIREEGCAEDNTCVIHKIDAADTMIRKLPYKLTAAQDKVIDEILEDLQGKNRMNRLVQGDVGSGKTIVAMIALAVICDNGYQGALMAPTEVLARQHYENFRNFFESMKLPFRCELLTGSQKISEKRKIYERIENHQCDIVIGTHALIQEKVNYHNLGLVVTDEQHRFGVRQRETFSLKGQMPHMLVMSATPIPRTLALIIYGDLDISVIDQVPVGRLPIKNCVVTPDYRDKAYRFMAREIAAGHQIYVVCPMVEASEEMDGENVIDYAAMLREKFPPEISIQYLHGNMKAAEKNQIMEAFAEGKTQILVSTTVIEVGVDVPNATVMMVENAERFGLAQLHQLRGRVGRGKSQSYCIFIDGSGKKEKNARLEVLNRSNDGFVIASEDLKLRGPGDVFGIRQSGDLQFALGDIYTDSSVLQQASEAAAQILKEDPALEAAENARLKNAMTEYAAAFGRNIII